MKTMTIAQWICYLNREVQELKNHPSSCSLLIGETPPVSSVGNNGDTYIKTIDGLFYHKSNDIWVEVGQLSFTRTDGGNF